MSTISFVAIAIISVFASIVYEFTVISRFIVRGFFAPHALILICNSYLPRLTGRRAMQKAPSVSGAEVGGTSDRPHMRSNRQIGD